MARRSQLRAGTTGGFLLNGCLTILGLLLAAVVGGVVWLKTEPARDEAQARKNLRENVEVFRDQLGGAAADSNLTDTEITRVFPPSKPARGLVGVTRQGGAVTVVAEVSGQGPPRAFIFVYEKSVAGCYAFEVPPPASGAPRPSVRELPQEACAAKPATHPGTGRQDPTFPWLGAVLRSVAAPTTALAQGCEARKGFGRGGCGLHRRLAHQFDRPEPTTKDWIKAARERGCLSPAVPGRPAAGPGPGPLLSHPAEVRPRSPSA